MCSAVVRCVGATDASLRAAAPQSTNRLAVGYVDSSIVVYDLFTASKLKSFKGHEGKVSCLAFDGAGEAIASYSSTEATVRTWQVSGVVGCSVWCSHSPARWCLCRCADWQRRSAELVAEESRKRRTGPRVCSCVAARHHCVCMPCRASARRRQSCPQSQLLLGRPMWMRL